MILNEAVWKPLIYQNNLYDRFEVSNDGHIRNATTKRVYKMCINKAGYFQVCVSLGCRDKKKVFKIHKAVAETFIPNPENKREVNHIDGDKQNNIVSNLEWTTHFENMQHASKTGLVARMYGMDNLNAKLSEEDVKYIREHYIPRDKEYGSRALGRKFKIDHSNVLDIVYGKSYINV